MRASKTKVYFVPGLAAGEEIFRNIKLPEDNFEVHIIPWLIPKKKESLSFYAKRMASFVKDENSVLIGVSFGGVMVQEMSSFLNLKKLIIISSVKTKYEIPSRLKWVKRLKVYNLLPTGLILSSRDLTKLAIGPRSRKRLKIYDEYLHVRDKQYLDWAIKNMVCWNREEALPQVCHIHGDEDIVFPIKNINHAIVISGGNHIMLLTKGVKVSEKIIEILSNN